MEGESVFIYLIIVILIIVIFVYACTVPIEQPINPKELNYMFQDNNWGNTSETLQSLIAVIVEPRNHPLLEHAIDMALQVCPSVMLFHGSSDDHIQQNKKWMEYVSEGKLILKKLPVENMSVAMYSALLLHPKFWESIPAEKIFIFQTDGAVCSGSGKTINEFLEYDYIGGPTYWSKRYGGGNGGVSLRSRKTMLDIIPAYADIHTLTLPEDLFISRGLKKYPHLGKTCTHDESYSFGSDELVNIKSNPFTMHKPSRLPPHVQEQVMLYCPEARPWIEYVKNKIK